MAPTCLICFYDLKLKTLSKSTDMVLPLGVNGATIMIQLPQFYGQPF